MRLTFMTAGLLLASSAAPAAPADPTRPQAEVPPARHQSALQHYRRSADAAPEPWPAANERVNRIGGWRAYAREPLPTAPTAPTAPAAAQPASSPHLQHGRPAQ